VNPDLLERLACPRHATRLSDAGAFLRCEAGHQYPVVGHIPVLLDEDPQTVWWAAESSLAHALRQGVDALEDRYYIDTTSLSENEAAALKARLCQTDSCIDPVVSFLVAATNGNAYKHLIGKLREYPIPELRLPPANGEILLDVGCGWGRWSIAAARLGYSPIGVDRSLGAVLAAERVTAQLGLYANFVVGDARSLPFRKAAVDVVFSYSVLQHLSRTDAIAAIKEIGRVLRPNGKSVIQMPTVLGVRCIYHQARRRFREARGVEVRYWSLPALRRLFAEHIGRPALSADCFFGIGLQAADLRLMPPGQVAIIRASELLRKTSRILPFLCYVADSVYVESIKAEAA
jgi:SAM-dependent methyltransferase/uncharacterized protein YbaR (Trm112 family)